MKKFLPTILFLFSSVLAFSCTCSSYEKTFFSAINSESYIFYAVFDTSYYAPYRHHGDIYTAYLTIIESMGKSDSNYVGRELILMGENGINCGDGLAKVKRGDTVFLTLDMRINHNYKPLFFSMDHCQRRYLIVRNGHNYGLSLNQIKHKIKTVLKHQDIACKCDPDNAYMSDFFSIIKPESMLCLAVFDRFDYGYTHKELLTQTAYFKLINNIANIPNNQGDSIVVIGQDGINCGAAVNFNKGDTIFLHLSQGYYRNFEKDTFALKGSTCGDYYYRTPSGKKHKDYVDNVYKRIRQELSSFKLTEENIKIYPNPSREYVRIESIRFNIDEIEIWNSHGKMLDHFFLTRTIHYDLNVSHLSEGLYIIKVKIKDEVLTKQLLVY